MEGVPVQNQQRFLEERLLAAAQKGETTTVRKLLRKMVNVNVKDAIGNSALSKACQGT